MMAVIGVRGLLAPVDPIGRRLDGLQEQQVGVTPLALRRGENSAASNGLRRFIAPMDPRERHRVQEQLMRAGFRGEQAFISYYLIRAVLGFLLPMPLVLASLVMSARGLAT